MRKLMVFNHVSLDGYFVDANGDMRWAHNPQDAMFEGVEKRLNLTLEKTRGFGNGNVVLWYRAA